jgi:MOSC domain-containing protein YiiM
MQELAAVRITVEAGLEGDSRGRPGRRQVTVLARSAWEAACSELNAPQLPWTTRRANLLVEGLELEGKIGDELRIGNTVLIICGETRPCERMNEAYPGLTPALEPRWRGGVTCRVVRSGSVVVGSPVTLERNLVRKFICIARVRAVPVVKRGRKTLGEWARKLGVR